MFKRPLQLLHREFHQITEAAFLLSLFTLLSQILALVRDRLLASYIGPSVSLDVYNMAFRVPDIIFAVGASLVSVTILIPFFTQKLEKTNKAEAQKFINAIFTVFLIFISIVSVIVFFLMPYLADFIAPGFDADAISELVNVSRILLLSPILLGVSNLLGTVTQAFKKFFVYGLAPVLYNVGIILGVVVFYPIFGIAGLAYGVILGAVFHVLIQLPVIIKKGFLPRLTFSFSRKEIWSIATISFPRTLTLALSTITLLILGAFATDIREGAVSIFNFAKNLQSVPLALIGASFSVAAFPTLVKSFATHDKREFIRHIIQPAQQIIFWSLPVMALFIVLRAQIVRVILGAGEFSWADTRLTAAALALFVVSVFAQSLILLIVRGYYAAGKTWRPFSISIFTSAFTVGLAYILIQHFTENHSVATSFEYLLRVSDVPGTAVLMLPLAYSIGAILNLIIMWTLFKREFIKSPAKKVNRTLWQSFLASLLMGFVAYVGLEIFDGIFGLTTTLGVFLQGAAAGILAIIVWVLTMVMFENSELLSFWASIRRRFWKTKLTITRNEETL